LYPVVAIRWTPPDRSASGWRWENWKHSSSGMRLATGKAGRLWRQSVCVLHTHGLPLPAWATVDFVERYDAVLTARASSWDTAFGPPFEKGTQLLAIRRRRTLAMKAYRRVNAMVEADEVPIDLAFQRVGHELGVSDSVVRDYFYFVKHRLPPNQS
jgi:hypothetical protein